MLHAQTTDPNMIESARDWRDDAGWKAFFERYASSIRKHACSSGLSEAEAEDVLQETMVKVVRYLPDFEYDRTICKFRTWLNQIVNQRIFETLNRRRKTMFPEEVVEELRQRLHPQAVSAEDPVRQAEADTRLLEACLARVRSRAKPKHWQLFESHAIHGKTASETAKLHGTTAANVWIVRHRLLKALRAEWKDLLEKPFTEDAAA